MSAETTTQRDNTGKFTKKSATPSDVEVAATALATPDGGVTPVIVKVTKDTYGLRLGTLSSRAAEMFTKGAKMAEVKKETGINHYNLLRKLESSGHKVTREDAVITLTRCTEPAPTEPEPEPTGDGGSAG